MTPDLTIPQMRPVARAATIMALLVAAVSLGRCGGGSTGPALSVNPRVGNPRSELRFSFIVPVATGVSGQTELDDTLSVAGPFRSGCVGFRTASLPSAARGRLLTVRLGPAELGGPWCAGAYTARVEELARPVCRLGQPCPQFIRVVGVVGRARFTIRG
jgi:hypothetical protein